MVAGRRGAALAHPAMCLLAGGALPLLSACAPQPASPRLLPRSAVPEAAFEWRLPPGFPPPRVPPENPISEAGVELGRHLFYDKRLSSNGRSACATCHRQELAFTDGRAQAVGTTGELHPRSAMSLANVAYGASLAWAAPRLQRLEEQAAVPMFNSHPVELGFGDREQGILSRLSADPLYVRLFSRAFPEESPRFTLIHVARGLASFERTLIAGNSPYHRFVYRDESEALSEGARRGMRLFFSERLGCSGCHAGFNLSGPVEFRGSGDVEPAFHNTGLYNVDGRGSYPAGNQGVFRHTGRSEDMGRFRAPTLINIARTAPYMHNGSLATLEQVVGFYAAGGRGADGEGRASPYTSPRITGFEITDEETRDLIHFLESLTDEEFLTDPRLSDPFPEQGLTLAGEVGRTPSGSASAPESAPAPRP